MTNEVAAVRRFIEPVLIGVFVVLFTPGVVSAAPALGKPGCRPNCRGRICGDDGCGGSCGACAKNRYCVKNRCVKGSGDPCMRIAGRWTGVMRITPVHRLDGRVSGTHKKCRARLRVSFYSSGGRGWVLQDFVVTFHGGTVRFRGQRIVANGSGAAYSLDTFTGRLNRSRTLFTGTLRDTRNVTGSVVLRRK